MSSTKPPIAPHASKPASPSTGGQAEKKNSKNAAADAVDVLLDMHSRQLAGKVVDTEFVAMVKGERIRDSDLPKAPPPPIEQFLIDYPIIPKAAGVAVAGAALYGLLLLLSPLWASYSASGKVVVNRLDAPDVELAFYAMPSGREVAKAVSSQTGDFTARGLGRGQFKVTAKSTGNTRVPEHYASPQTTPLSFTLDKSMSNLMLYVTDAKPSAAPKKYDD